MQALKPKTRALDVNSVFSSQSNLITFLNTINGTKVAQVSPQTAMCITAIYACVELITDTCSLISPKIYRYDLTGRYVDYQHDQNRLLNKYVNDYTTSIEWDKLWTRDFLIWGNGYAEIIRNSSGRPVNYVNLLPYEIEVIFNNGEKNYIYRPEGGENRVISNKNMLHLSKLAIDHRLAAESPIELNKKTINDGLIVSQYGSDMYKNGVQLSGYIYGEQPMDAAGREILRSSFENKYKDKSGQVGILPYGYKYEQLKYNLPFADAAMIEAKKMSSIEICMMFRVPAALLNLSETADNKSEVLYNNFLLTTIASIQRLKENQLSAKIFKPSQMMSYEVKYNLKGLLRTSIQERYEAHRIAINSGFMNPDEIRAIEDLNPCNDGSGKEYMKPLNSIPASLWNKYYVDMIENKKINPNA